MDTIIDSPIAWATDIATGTAIHIGELGSLRNGNKSGCRCDECGDGLVAVNAGKDEYILRPHFRHPAGAARGDCIVAASRAALRREIEAQGYFLLPGRYRSRAVEGLSGKQYEHSASRPASRVGVFTSIKDVAKGILALEDGRQLVVRLVAYGARPSLDGILAQAAVIDIEVDADEIAMMAPNDLRQRIRLLPKDGSCWRRHWDDPVLDAESEILGRLAAANADDDVDDSNLPQDISPIERRETLLHREIKAIIERERRIRLPGLTISARWHRKDGFIDEAEIEIPDQIVQPTSVRLEAVLPDARPDVIIHWVSSSGAAKTALLEVTVTNPLSPERIHKLAAYGNPVLEIDTREILGTLDRKSLTKLVVESLDGKHWRFHPEIESESAKLIQQLQAREAAVLEERAKQQHLLAIPASDYGRKYFEAYIEYADATEAGNSSVAQEAERRLDEASKGLVAHGHNCPHSGVSHHRWIQVMKRLSSFKLGRPVGYKFDTIWQVVNAIQQDQPENRVWYAYYLMALQTYQPPLEPRHLGRVREWRSQVISNLEFGGTTYLRDTVFDRLLCVVFPELRNQIRSNYGIEAKLPKPRGSPVPIVRIKG